MLHPGKTAGDTNSRNKRILLVEDEALIAMAEAQMLNEHGYSVIAVMRGEDALQEATANDLDLILMDIDLGRGRMEGTEVARRILETHEIPVIFLTSHSEKAYVDTVEGISSYGYVLKSEG